MLRGFGKMPRVPKRKIQTSDGASASQLFNFNQGSYLERTTRPVYAIAFLLPLIILYEVGTLLVNTDVLHHCESRVVAFVWLKYLAQFVGFEDRVSFMVLPLLVLLVLAGLQFATGKKWEVNLADTMPMGAECVLESIPLVMMGLLLSRPAAPQAAAMQSHGLAGEIVTGIGAGIYEEFVFRLVFICLLMILFQNLLGMKHMSSAIASILISSALFSAYHHINILPLETGIVPDPFTWPKFIFRTVAGVYFAGLFAVRGFGITVGTHAVYDIIVALMKADMFVKG
jgi:membrane protease YdiL (CAAX protease family)